MRIAATLLTTVLGVLAAVLVGASPAAAATSYVWSGQGDGVSWTDPTNWSPVGLPATGDAVSVQAPSDGVCHAHVHGIPTGLRLADLTVDEHLYQGNADSPCLTSLDDGAITVTHALTLHAGTITSAVTIAAGATGTVTPGAAHDTTHLAGAVTVDGTLTVAHTTDPELLSLTGGSVTVDAGGTFIASGDNHLTADCCGSVAHLRNNGTLQVGAGTLTLDAVELDQDASLTAAGGTIVSVVAPQTAGPGATWSGPGTWRLGRSSVTTASGTQTLSGGFTWGLGGHGSTAAEHLTGTFTLAGSGTFEWAGGHLDGAMTTSTGVGVVAAGAQTVDDPRALDDRGGATPALTVQGGATFSGGAGWYGYGGGTLAVASTGTLTLGAGTAIGADCCGTTAAVVNQGGSVVVPSGAGTVTLADTGYRATGGRLTVGSGSHLELTGHSPSSLTSTTVTGTGVLGVATAVTTGGIVTIGSSTTLQLRPGSALTTAGTTTTTVSGAGRFGWSGGSVTGHLRVATTGGQAVSGATEKDLLVPTGASGSVLSFGGPTTFAAGTSATPDLVAGTSSSAQLVFTGSLTVAANTRVTGAAVHLHGSTTVAATTGVARVDAGATLTNDGRLTVASGTLTTDATVTQTAGTTTVASGSTLSAPTVSARGGTVSGAGRVSGRLALTAATLDPTGTLTVTSVLTTTSASTLRFDLAGTSHDALTVGGTATLAGTLVLADADGYQPATGDLVAVVTAPTLTTAFGCTTTTGAGASSQHWTAARATGPVRLQLTSVAGAAATC